jgi:hypothetical protein
MRKQRPFRDGFDERAKSTVFALNESPHSQHSPSLANPIRNKSFYTASTPSGPSFPFAEGRKRADECAFAGKLSERVKPDSPREVPTRPD